MTAAELERKRAFDRNSQKASRARRLAYIHELEVELELLQSLPSSENHDGENVVQKLSQRNQQLETEITRLRLAYGFQGQSMRARLWLAEPVYGNLNMSVLPQPLDVSRPRIDILMDRALIQCIPALESW